MDTALFLLCNVELISPNIKSTKIKIRKTFSLVFCSNITFFCCLAYIGKDRAANASLNSDSIQEQLPHSEEILHSGYGIYFSKITFNPTNDVLL